MQRDEMPNLLASRMTPDGKREAVDKDAYSTLLYSIGKNGVEARRSGGEDAEHIKREAEELDTRDEDASDSDLYPVLAFFIKKDEGS